MRKSTDREGSRWRNASAIDRASSDRSTRRAIDLEARQPRHLQQAFDQILHLLDAVLNPVAAYSFPDSSRRSPYIRRAPARNRRYFRAAREDHATPSTKTPPARGSRPPPLSCASAASDRAAGSVPAACSGPAQALRRSPFPSAEPAASSSSLRPRRARCEQRRRSAAVAPFAQASDRPPEAAAPTRRGESRAEAEEQRDGLRK